MTAIIRISPDGQQAEAWAFVLEAVGVPHQVMSMTNGWAVLVDPADAARASAALEAHDREAAEPASDHPPPDHGASPVALLVPAALVAFFFITGPRGPGPWFSAGSAVADRIVAGDLARAVTALTLHADLAHVAGNALSLAIFLSALCRWLGAGLAMSLVLASGIVGNLVTAFVHGAHHDSVGASTAAFGAIGILGGLQFVRRFRVTTRVDRRRRALTAIAACLGLFAMLGVGERSDVLAHLFGLGAGLVLGLVAGLVVRRPLTAWAQVALGLGAAGTVAGAWILALG